MTLITEEKTISLQKSQCPVHCLPLTPSQMANLCDLVIISLKQAATFGLEVVIHSKAEAFQSEPPERLKQWHWEIPVIQQFFFSLCCCCSQRSAWIELATCSLILRRFESVLQILHFNEISVRFYAPNLYERTRLLFDWQYGSKFDILVMIAMACAFVLNSLPTHLLCALAWHTSDT